MESLAKNRLAARVELGRKYLTDREWKAFLDVASAEPRDLALVLTLYEGALRASEPGRLTLADTRELHHGKLYVRRGKGSREGFVRVSMTARDALLTWIDTCYPVKAKRRAKQWLFPGRGGRLYGKKLVPKGLSRRSVYEIVVGIAHAARVPEALAHPHTLKHTRVMHVVAAAEEAGVPWHRILPLVAELVGHRQAETTLKWYLGTRDSERVLVAGLTDEIFNR